MTLLPLQPNFLELPPGTRLGRIHQCSGPHPAEWFEMRSYGPLHSGRFDQHSPPPHDDPEHSVMYTARYAEGIDLLHICVAETFAANRIVPLRLNSPHFTVFDTAAPLRVAHVGHSTSNRAITQRWARTQCGTLPTPQGVLYPSSQTPHLAPAENVCLWGPQAAPAIPAHPEISIPLSSPALLGDLQQICSALDYLLVP